MKKITIILSLLLVSGSSFAQLCTPTFLNGCFSWKNQSIYIGTIDWMFDNVDCSQSDYTTMSTDITAGTATTMSVTAGDWCGCSVWIDINHDNTLDDSENFFHEGNGGEASHTFDFSITLPPSTINGFYTMRVIASWGSDGFTPGTNGSGGCGDFQYGSFQDFTIRVIGGVNAAGLNENQQASKISVAPNPVENNVLISSEKAMIGSTYFITSTLGSVVAKGTIQSEQENLSVSDLCPGIYLLHLSGQESVVRFVKH